MQDAIVGADWRPARLVLWLTALALCLPAVEARAQSVWANGRELSAPGARAALVREALDFQATVIAGDGEADQETLLAAGAEVIEALQAAGYSVLVLPIGIFEGAWVDAALDAPLPESLSSWPIYRVWQESPGFRALLESVHAIRSAGGELAVTGLLSRYHAIGKTLYAPHLLAALAAGGAPAPAALEAAIEEFWAGPDRLARSTPEHRASALDLADRVLAHVDAEREQLETGWGADRFARERHFLVNMRTFVQLEQLRGGDLEGDDTFADRESQQNLDWFQRVGYPSRRLILWEGRGSNPTSVPGGAYRIALTVDTTPDGG